MKISWRSLFVLQILAAALGSTLSLIAADWPMFGHDPQRSGWASEERTLTADNVRRLELKWKVKLKNEPKFLNALTAPVVATDVQTPQGKMALVYVAGTSNNFYALEAATGSVYWSRNFPTRFHPGDTPHAETVFCPDTITATPAIDRGTATIYVIAMDGFLYGLDLATGKDKFQPMPFVAPFSKNWSLNLVDGVVFTTLTQGCGDGPSGFYAMDIKNPRHPVVRRLLTSTSETGGIWGRGGPVAGTNHRIYGLTADGRFNPANGEFGSSVVAASLPDLDFADYFTPKNWQEINRRDLDLASSSPVWFTDGKYELLAGGGKEGVLYLLDAQALGGADHQTPLYVSPLLGNDAHSYQLGGIWGAPAVRQDESGRPWIYVPLWGPVSTHAPVFPTTHGPNPHGSIMAFRVGASAGAQTPTLEPMWVSGDFNLPDPPIIANGVVFELSTGENADQKAEDRTKNTRPGVLYALDAKTGAVLFTSGGLIHSWVHFSGLALADGQVYVVDHDSWVYCFGLSQE